MADRQSVNRPEPVTRFLFNDSRAGILWLPLRVWLGWKWLSAGLGKVGAPAWTGENAGAAVAGFVNGALAKAAGDHPDVQAWYAWFLENAVLPNATVFGYLVAYGEVLVGLALLTGFLTGVAAFFGTVMNMSFLLAGTVSVNPILFAAGTLLVLAWKVAGHWGLDYWLLPTLGTPWDPGQLFKNRRTVPVP